MRDLAVVTRLIMSTCSLDSEDMHIPLQLGLCSRILLVRVRHALPLNDG